MNGTHPRFPPHSVGVANLATRWHEVPLAPSLRELLSEREAEGVRYDKMDVYLWFRSANRRGGS